MREAIRVANHSPVTPVISRSHKVCGPRIRHAPQVAIPLNEDALLEMNKSPDPIFGNGRMTLTCGVFGQKNIARTKRLDRSVPDSDIDGTRQGDHPLASRRVMEPENMGRIIVFEDEAFYGVGR